MIVMGLKLVSEDKQLSWLGLCAPNLQPFNYLEVMKKHELAELKVNIEIKQG